VPTRFYSSIALFGGRQGYLNKEFSLWWSVDNLNNLRYTVNHDQLSIQLDNYTDERLITTRVQKSQTSGNYLVYIDIDIGGQIISQFVTRSEKEVVGTHPLWILAINNNGNKLGSFIGKLFEFSCTNSGEEVFNFIPALDTNKRPCLYDTVSKQPFYNAGTGEFLYG
jgi:hypothetical protein